MIRDSMISGRMSGRSCDVRRRCVHTPPVLMAMSSRPRPADPNVQLLPLADGEGLERHRRVARQRREDVVGLAVGHEGGDQVGRAGRLPAAGRRCAVGGSEGGARRSPDRASGAACTRSRTPLLSLSAFGRDQGRRRRLVGSRSRADGAGVELR